MRERNRRQMARIKSHRATAAELREAKVRLKEIEEEFADIELRPETRQGEERDARYARVLKLRAMRDQFEAEHPYDKRTHPNSVLLSVVMIVSSFLLCACVAGGTYAGLRFFTDKPDPVSVAGDFWSAMQGQQYATAHEQFLHPTLRVQVKESTFINDAQQADIDYGPITGAVLSSKQTSAASATLVYKVTRTDPQSGKATTYDTTLAMEIFQQTGAWGITDMGATIDPTLAGAKAPDATPTPQPTATPKK